MNLSARISSTLTVAVVLGAVSCAADPAPEASQTYAEIVLASYEDSLASAETLQDKVQAFLDDPSQKTLDAARVAWMASREPYLQTEAFRFYDGPIDEVEGTINAWPLDENFIDSTNEDSESPIVRNHEIEISGKELEGLNEQGGEKNIATGYHAIEFLLWGQDTDPDGPGDRPFTDYTTAEDADRRGEYLKTVTELLVGHLEDLVSAWKVGKKNYRADWDAESSSELLRRMLTGMLILSGFETGGERIEAALQSGDQEDEHSCFSDNTHRDMVQDVRGVQNVWKGRYERLDGSLVQGTGVGDVVRARDPERADRIDKRIDAALEKAEALEPPFDQEISSANPDGRARVLALAEALRAVEKELKKVFEGFDLDVPNE